MEDRAREEEWNLGARVWGNPRRGTQIRRLREGSRVLVCGSISGPI